MPNSSVLVAMLAASTAHAGTVIYVDDDAPSGGDGSSWAEAHRFLQDALAEASAGSEIRVAQGAYHPDRDAANPDVPSDCCTPFHPGGGGCDDAVCEELVCAADPTCCVDSWDFSCASMAADSCDVSCADRNATFRLVNGVALHGGFAGLGQPDPDLRDVTQFETILSGDLLGNDQSEFGPERRDNSLHVVTGSGTNGTAVIDGFIITSGDGLASCSGGGAGMINDSGSPTISNCTFAGNTAVFFDVATGGGAMLNRDSSPTVVNCFFVGNRCALSCCQDCQGGGRGGAIFNYNSAPMVSDCTFSDNSDGAIFNYKSSPTITDCDFLGNSGHSGGGIHNEEGSSPIVSGCVFVGNIADGFFFGGMGAFPAGQGGGIYNTLGSHATVSDCTFQGNIANSGGGGLANEVSDLILVNCTFSGNQAEGQFPGGPTGRGGGLYNASGSLTVIDCVFTDNAASSSGGGVHNSSVSSSMLTNCTFDGNTTEQDGGAMYNGGGSPMVTNCTFAGNSGRNGGAMFNDCSAPTVINCTFDANAADAENGGGGGMYNYCSDASIGESAFSRNSSGGGGGGGMRNEESSPSMNGCRFVANVATQGDGGGINNLDSNPVLTNCILVGNMADNGGGMYNLLSNPTVINCTLAGNVATGLGGAMMNSSCDVLSCNLPSFPLLQNSVFSGNLPDQLVDSSGFPGGVRSQSTAIHCNVQGGWPGNGNIDADPMFVDAANGDLRLQSGSPCIDAGHNNAIAGLTDTDLDGNPRFAGARAADDVGCGTPVVVDLGAYEYQGIPATVVLADLTGDAIVDMNDLDALLKCWASKEQPCCSADLDLDGAIGVVDFLALLAKWS